VASLFCITLFLGFHTWDQKKWWFQQAALGEDLTAWGRPGGGGARAPPHLPGAVLHAALAPAFTAFTWCTCAAFVGQVECRCCKSRVAFCRSRAQWLGAAGASSGSGYKLREAGSNACLKWEFLQSAGHEETGRCCWKVSIST
jgi:hypothetical protein